MKVNLLIKTALCALIMCEFSHAQESHRVETETTETAYITSIWVGTNAFVDKPQWTGDGKSFYLLESTGAIFQLQYPTFDVLKAGKLEVDSTTLGIAQRRVFFVD